MKNKWIKATSLDRVLLKNKKKKTQKRKCLVSGCPNNAMGNSFYCRKHSGMENLGTKANYF